MKTPRLLILALTALAAAVVTAAAEGGSGLLLPFPEEASGEPSSRVPDRAIPPPSASAADDASRAMELADTFIRRQQMEIANSVPKSGTAAPLRIPVRKVPDALRSGTAIAAAKTEPPALDTIGRSTAGPSTDLLPLPGDDSLGPPVESVLPDASLIQGPGDAPPEVPAVSPESPESEVPRSELAPAPTFGSVENQERRGPVFRVGGPEAFAVARARGFRFTPAGGIGVRDGNHTAASQFPNLLTSEVHGTRMSQLRPPATWSVQETSNTFFMFCDSSYNAVRLAPGWRIRGIRLEGPNWRWVACPRSGAGTASFSIRVHAFKGQEAATSVQLAGLTLEGPPGATDWKEAFPWINGKGPESKSPGHQPPPEALAGTSPSGEPALPR